MTLGEGLARLLGRDRLVHEQASPKQKRYVERFNGSMRGKLLDGELFHLVVEARVEIGQWHEIYNHSRPHRS